MSAAGAEQTCAVDGCPKAGTRHGYCWAHLKRKQRGRPLHEPLKPYAQPPKALLVEAALAYADADTEDEVAYSRAWHRLRVTARRYTAAPKPNVPASG